MPSCPECGGEMGYDPRLRLYMCKSCGLSLTSQELMELKDKMHSDKNSVQEERKKKRNEYLDWWLSRKG